MHTLRDVYEHFQPIHDRIPTESIGPLKFIPHETSRRLKEGDLDELRVARTAAAKRWSCKKRVGAADAAENPLLRFIVPPAIGIGAFGKGSAAGSCAEDEEMKDDDSPAAASATAPEEGFSCTDGSSSISSSDDEEEPSADKVVGPIPPSFSPPKSIRILAGNGSLGEDALQINECLWKTPLWYSGRNTGQRTEKFNCEEEVRVGVRAEVGGTLKPTRFAVWTSDLRGLGARI